MFKKTTRKTHARTPYPYTCQAMPPEKSNLKTKEQKTKTNFEKKEEKKRENNHFNLNFP
jgi:hypothetical protein